ncbi:HTH-type transcriptional regulator VirS [compost metagenome]
MQRALGDEGASFHDILHAVRREQAPRHVENPRVPLAQVAVLLGYGSPSTFTRWFSGEFGMAPSAWRAQAAARTGAA